MTDRFVFYSFAQELIAGKNKTAACSAEQVLPKICVISIGIIGKLLKALALLNTLLMMLKTTANLPY